MSSKKTTDEPAGALILEERLRRLTEIGVILSAEHDLYALLELILSEARAFTRADAGTLYLLQGDQLNFEITHNDTMGRRDSHWYEGVDIPPLPLDKNSASGFAATTGEILNIADVYRDQAHNFEGPQNYDKPTGYHTQSMIVVPMKDHQDRVIAVLQLLNATDEGGAIIPFSQEEEILIQSLASQAAVAINNVRLIEETRRLSRQMVQSERMASVGVLAAGIVHNLRNPLTTILGFGELIKTQNPNLDGLEEIVEAGQRMNEMVEDILTKSRQHKDTEQVDFNLLLHRELDFMEVDSSFKHNVEKTIELADDLPLFECAYTDFSQALGNLLRNALDAMYERPEKKLTVRSIREEHHIVLEIGDTGCGIPAENISSLFDPFYTTKTTEPNGDEPVGTGLGLYMIVLLMEPYGVEIKVDSKVNVGTTFRLEIPRTDSRTPSDPLTAG